MLTVPWAPEQVKFATLAACVSDAALKASARAIELWIDHSDHLDNRENVWKTAIRGVGVFRPDLR
jgi:hypothetical protein